MAYSAIFYRAINRLKQTGKLVCLLPWRWQNKLLKAWHAIKIFFFDWTPWSLLKIDCIKKDLDLALTPKSWEEETYLQIWEHENEDSKMCWKVTKAVDASISFMNSSHCSSFPVRRCNNTSAAASSPFLLVDIVVVMPSHPRHPGKRFLCQGKIIAHTRLLITTHRKGPVLGQGNQWRYFGLCTKIHLGCGAPDSSIILLKLKWLHLPLWSLWQTAHLCKWKFPSLFCVIAAWEGSSLGFAPCIAEGALNGL